MNLNPGRALTAAARFQPDEDQMDTKILAIDPGPEASAYVLYAGGRVLDGEKIPSVQMLEYVRDAPVDGFDVLAIEMIQSFGMAVGAEVFETCVWIGRFLEAWGGASIRIYRGDVKIHLCGSMRAKDPNIRAALIDRYGPGKDKAIGTKKAPGPLYGISGDVWSALAVAVTAEHQMEEARKAAVA